MKKFVEMSRITGVSADGMQWLTEAIDPYHDNQLHLVGLPDLMAAPSVVQMHNQSYTLTAPASAVADWDATVAFTGCLTAIGADVKITDKNSGNNMANRYNHASLGGVEFGTFIVRAGDKAANLPVGKKLSANDTYEAFGGAVLAKQTDRCRLIGVAFEITNTTAEIYKQGSITVAQLPGPIGDTATVQFIDENAAPWTDRTCQCWCGPTFAVNRSDLLAIPGSATWSAKEGLYAIPRMFTHTMLVDNPLHNGRVALVQDSAADTVYSMTQPTTSMSDTTVMPDFYGVSTTGFTGMQCFLTGLSHETSLTVTFRTIVEYFPSPVSTLLPLAVPSPSYDPLAFEVYSRIVRTAPYAVTVKENSAGEYFRRVLAVVSRIGSYVAPLLGPAAGPVAALSSVGSDFARVLERRAKKAQASSQPKKPLQITRRAAGAGAMPTRR